MENAHENIPGSSTSSIPKFLVISSWAQAQELKGRGKQLAQEGVLFLCGHERCQGKKTLEKLHRIKYASLPFFSSAVTLYLQLHDLPIHVAAQSSFLFE